MIISQIIGGKLSLEHEVRNTRGVYFITDVLKDTKIVLMDTEGFYQPLDTVDPIPKQDFTLEFMKRTTGLLILVVNRITTHDVLSLNTIIRYYQNNSGFKNMIVVHNLKDIHEVESMEHYRTGLMNTFGLSLDLNFPFELLQKAGSKEKSKQIIHLICGNKHTLSELFDRTIERLRTNICGVPLEAIGLRFEITSAMIGTLYKHYALDPKLLEGRNMLDAFVFNQNQGLEIIEYKNPTGYKRRSDRENNTTSNDVGMYWYIDRNDYKTSQEDSFVKVVIEGGGLFLHDAKLDITNEKTVQFSGTREKLDDENMKKDCIQILDLPFGLMRTQRAKNFTNQSVKQRPSGLIIFNLLITEDIEEMIILDESRFAKTDLDDV
jgi:hypothetical protein